MPVSPGGRPAGMQVGRKRNGGHGDSKLAVRQQCTFASKKTDSLLGHQEWHYRHVERKVIFSTLLVSFICSIGSGLGLCLIQDTMQIGITEGSLAELNDHLKKRGLVPLFFILTDRCEFAVSVLWANQKLAAWHCVKANKPCREVGFIELIWIVC